MLGFDGGLPANFLLELYDAEKMELKSQVTNKVPIFEVSNIDPGTSIKLYLYAENAKGTSDPAIIDDSVPNQQKHFVEGMFSAPSFLTFDIRRTTGKKLTYISPHIFRCYRLQSGER